MDWDKTFANGCTIRKETLLEFIQEIIDYLMSVFSTFQNGTIEFKRQLKSSVL